MKSYKDVTNRYMAHNKKRSILTIIGVILSVALITAVGLFIKSMQDSMVQQTISDKGAQHLMISKIDDSGYDKIKNNAKVEEIGIVEDSQSAALKDGKSISIKKFNKQAADLLPSIYKTSKGRMPKSDSEIVLESWVLNYFGNSPKIGDTIILKLSDGGEKSFKLTGILPSISVSQSSGSAVGMVYSDKFDIKNCTLYVKINKKAGIRNTVNEISKQFKKVEVNKDLLNYSGEGSNNLNKSIYTLLAIVIGIVVIATVAVIYNSFQISVMERIKQFGLLRAVGATPKQVRKTVLREASIISAVGVPLGLLSGIFAMYIISKVFNMMSGSAFLNMKVDVPYYLILISAAVGVVSIYVSALIPAVFASKISPLMAISSRAAITKEKIKKNRGRIAKKFLSISGLMAFKNIKRSRKKFRVTVFSIAISIILFIVFSSFINMSQNFTGSSSESEKMHFEVDGTIGNNNKSSLNENIADEIRQNKNVKDMYVSYGTYKSVMLMPNSCQDSHIKSEYKDVYSSGTLDGKSMTQMNMYMDIYDSSKLASIKSYVKSGSIDGNMADENGVILVKNNMVLSKKKMYHGPLTDLKVGDTIYVYKNVSCINMSSSSTSGSNKNNSKNSFESSGMVKLKIAAVVDDAPYSMDIENLGVPQFIVPRTVMENITGKSDFPMKFAEIKLKDKNKANDFSNWIQPIGDKNNLKVMDEITERESLKANNSEMSILMYGFIIVISLIGAVNIINTITTNIILRRKEIASLNAIGMTYKNIRNMIVSEGVLYGVYGAFYGCVLGVILSYFISSSYKMIMDFKFQIPWKYMALASAVAIAIGIIAVIKPLMNIKKDNVVEVMREED